MEHNFERLKDAILPLSSAADFESARQEWRLIGVAMHDEFTRCPCGQPIKERCMVKNDKTGKTAVVGNVCVGRFMGIETGALFAGLKRIQDNNEANANMDVINHALQLGYIYEKEHAFLLQTMRKRKLSDKQLGWKRKINLRILNQTVVAPT